MGLRNPRRRQTCRHRASARPYRHHAHLVRHHATRWFGALDPLHSFSDITEPFAAMVDAVGRALQAWTGRYGPADDPWSLVVILSGGALLAPAGRLANLVHPLDRA